MRAFCVFCMIVAAPLVWAKDQPVFSHAVCCEHRAAGAPLGPAVFGALRGRGASGAVRAMPASMALTGDIRIPRAIGANALTVAEIITRSAQLKDQLVMVRGRVVKYFPEIMGRNWVHLRDGTGSAVDESNDLVVTTEDEAQIGEVVTAKGIVRTDLDFGSGYTYKVLLDEATLQSQPR